MPRNSDQKFIAASAKKSDRKFTRVYSSIRLQLGSEFWQKQQIPNKAQKTLKSSKNASASLLFLFQGLFCCLFRFSNQFSSIATSYQNGWIKNAVVLFLWPGFGLEMLPNTVQKYTTTLKQKLNVVFLWGYPPNSKNTGKSK